MTGTGLVYTKCQWMNLDRKKARLLACTNGLYLPADDKGRYMPDMTCEPHDEYRSNVVRLGEDPYERACFDPLTEIETALVTLSIAVREMIMREHGWHDQDLFAATYAARVIELTEMFRTLERNRQRFVAHNSLLGRVEDHQASLGKILLKRSKLTGVYTQAHRDRQAIRRLQETLIERGP